MLFRKAAQGYVVSDTHYLSSRSCYDQVRDEIDALFAQAEHIVLNGDIFDFRWSTLPNIAAAVQEASQEIERLCVLHAQARIHYVLGNHDCHPLFAQALTRLSQRFPHLSQHEHELQLGSNLFVHGDILQAGSRTRLESYRRRFHRDHYLLKGFDPLYQAVHHLGLAGFYSQISSSQAAYACAKRFHQLLEQGELPVLGEVNDVYYGHTHIPSTKLLYKGRRYHNTGAVLIRTPWKILPFKVS